MGIKLDEVRLGHQKKKEEGRIGCQWWKNDWSLKQDRLKEM